MLFCAALKRQRIVAVEKPDANIFARQKLDRRLAKLTVKFHRHRHGGLVCVRRLMPPLRAKIRFAFDTLRLPPSVFVTSG